VYSDYAHSVRAVGGESNHVEERWQSSGLQAKKIYQYVSEMVTCRLGAYKVEPMRTLQQEEHSSTGQGLNLCLIIAFAFGSMIN
jgi:hypothetical protein